MGPPTVLAVITGAASNRRGARLGRGVGSPVFRVDPFHANALVFRSFGFGSDNDR